jgi:hypothetical protein
MCLLVPPSCPSLVPFFALTPPDRVPAMTDALLGMVSINLLLLHLLPILPSLQQQRLTSHVRPSHSLSCGTSSFMNLTTTSSTVRPTTAQHGSTHTTVKQEPGISSGSLPLKKPSISMAFQILFNRASSVLQTPPHRLQQLQLAFFTQHLY